MKALKKFLREFGATLSAFAGGVAAIVALWAMLGVATSGDIKRIDCKYAPSAVAAYEQRQINLLTIPPPTDPRQRYTWERVLKENEQALKEATDLRTKCGG